MARKKQELFFVRETPDNYEFDIHKAKRISITGEKKLLKASKKKKSKKAA
jgi:hypothetical protein